MKDYRKQTIKPGVYTMRLGYSPADGNHGADIAPHAEFCLLVAAAKDPKAEVMPIKGLIQVSTDSSGGDHPRVFLLFPNNKPAAAPTFVSKGNNHWVINSGMDVQVGGQTVSHGLGIGL